MGAEIRDIDKGYRAIVDQFERIDGAALEVGYFKNNMHPSGEFTAYIAMIHEYGWGITSKRSGGTRIMIPERSFMRSTMDAKRGRYADMMVTVNRDIASGKSGDKALYVMGEEVAGDFTAAIIDLRSPPNALSTIRRKGSSNPLVDTLHMAKSVQHRVVER